MNNAESTCSPGTSSLDSLYSVCASLPEIAFVRLAPSQPVMQKLIKPSVVAVFAQQQLQGFAKFAASCTWLHLIAAKGSKTENFQRSASKCKTGSVDSKTLPPPPVKVNRRTLTPQPASTFPIVPVATLTLGTLTLATLTLATLTAINRHVTATYRGHLRLIAPIRG